MILILQLELAFAPQIIAMMIYLTTIINSVCTENKKRKKSHKKAAWKITKRGGKFLFLSDIVASYFKRVDTS